MPPDTFTVLYASRENKFTGERNIAEVVEAISSGYNGLCKPEDNSVHAIFRCLCSSSTRERLGGVTVTPPRPRTPGEINRRKR